MGDAAEQPTRDGGGPVTRLTRVPVILWTHVAWELLRVFLVTTGIIVTVIAFGAAAKPLADSSIGANTVLKYVTMAIVPMLQFAMPFAAGFAATLVMHRFATDNEVVAMSACGMSHRRIMAPVAILGGALCVAMLVLVSMVIPRFWVRMKELATADATQGVEVAEGDEGALELHRGRRRHAALALRLDGRGRADDDQGNDQQRERRDHRPERDAPGVRHVRAAG